MNVLLFVAPLIGALALAYAFGLGAWVRRQDAGNAVMTEIAAHIADGARAFLRREYRVLFFLSSPSRRCSRGSTSAARRRIRSLPSPL